MYAVFFLKFLLFFRHRRLVTNCYNRSLGIVAMKPETWVVIKSIDVKEIKLNRNLSIFAWLEKNMRFFCQHKSMRTYFLFNNNRNIDSNLWTRIEVRLEIVCETDREREGAGVAVRKAIILMLDDKIVNMGRKWTN